MTIVVTGATGPFGRHAVEALLRRGVPADQIVAAGRDTGRIQDLGVRVERISYDEPDSLARAFAGADRLLFVSGSEVGRRIAQHRNVVDAAKAAGVRFIAYTSVPHADTTDMKLAAEHRATEQMITESGLPHTFLRNGWYLENYNPHTALEHGLTGSAGEGRISGATRADLAEAAAAALLMESPKPVYELGGEPFTLSELAAVMSEVTGRTIAYTDLPEDRYAEVLTRAGVPAPVAAILADSDSNAARGALYVEPDDLESLLGRPATRPADAIRAALS